MAACQALSYLVNFRLQQLLPALPQQNTVSVSTNLASQQLVSDDIKLVELRAQIVDNFMDLNLSDRCLIQPALQCPSKRKLGISVNIRRSERIRNNSKNRSSLSINKGDSLNNILKTVTESSSKMPENGPGLQEIWCVFQRLRT